MFVVTFDDGYENVYHNAWPILKELSVPATVFLVTSYLDADRPFASDDWAAAGSAGVPATAWRPLSTAQCAEMIEHGLVEIGSHTHTHADFRGRPEAFRRDLARSLDVLREPLGVAQAPFAFPFGHAEPELIAAAREAGVTCALTAEPEPVAPQADPFTWGRFTVAGSDTAATLALKLSGWYTSLARRLAMAAAAVDRDRLGPTPAGTPIGRRSASNRASRASWPARSRAERGTRIEVIGKRCHRMSSIADMLLEHSEPGEPPPRLAPRVTAPAADAAAPMVRTGMFSIFDQGGRQRHQFPHHVDSRPRLLSGRGGRLFAGLDRRAVPAAVQGNLITVPYTMYCHRRSGEALAEYAGSTLIHQLITSLAAVACFLGLAVLLSLGFGPERLRPAAWVLLGVIPFILLREYARRFAFAHLAVAAAITIDVVVAVLQLGALLVLLAVGVALGGRGVRRDGAACAVACLCWWLLDRQPMRFSRRPVRRRLAAQLVVRQVGLDEPTDRSGVLHLAVAAGLRPRRGGDRRTGGLHHAGRAVEPVRHRAEQFSHAQGGPGVCPAGRPRACPACCARRRSARRRARRPVAG